ncbi:MAG: sigma-54-dependent Fis family transcriptional regulator [Planctomycetes bacterium]|nr:sigma-54-dependent Fis family transcriptional regulator [Planctomycetota bacterium]
MNEAQANFRVLLVDDDTAVLNALAHTVRRLGYPCTSFADPLAAKTAIAADPPELVILDLIMPQCGGEELLAWISASFPEVAVVMSSALGDLETAVRCMRAGAIDFLPKPCSPDCVSACLRRATALLEARGLAVRLSSGFLKPAPSHPEAFANLLTRSENMLGMFRYCEAVAKGSDALLVSGETGTGKELVARALHKLSGRSGAFVAVNAAAVGDMNFDDTLFGHQRGAYTGAEQTRKGLLEEAAEGTILLDEIGDLAEVCQIKLLRLLQEREFRPLGSDTPKHLKARILVATHQNLEANIAAGRFRRDLYYRLCTFRVELPPLRERKDDIPLLAAHFAAEAAAELKVPAPSFGRGALATLMAAPWPGNVRELRAVVIEAVSQGPQISAKWLTTRLKLAPHLVKESADTFPTLRESAEALIQEALKRSGGNQKVAARLLGLSAPALSLRLKTMRNMA